MTKYLIICAATILGAFAARDLPFDDLYEERIVGGENAKEGQLPYIVSIQREDSHFCGGTIVNKWTVLTVVQCVRGSDPSSLQVVAGITNLSDEGEKYVAEKLLQDSSGDFGFIILKDPIKFSDKVRAVQNLESQYHEENRTGVASGWGIMGGPNTSDNLQFINLTTISESECLELLCNVGAGNICTLTKRGEEMCRRDYGSPLVVGEGDQETLIGVLVRVFSPCAVGYPDVFTKVFFYIDWIKENLKE